MALETLEAGAPTGFLGLRDLIAVAVLADEAEPLPTGRARVAAEGAVLPTAVDGQERAGVEVAALDHVARVDFPDVVSYADGDHAAVIEDGARVEVLRSLPQVPPGDPSSQRRSRENLSHHVSVLQYLPAPRIDNGRPVVRVRGWMLA